MIIQEQDQIQSFLDPGSFYELSVKRVNLLLFAIFIVWTEHPTSGRVNLGRFFSLRFGIFLDSNLISRSMKDMNIQNAPKKSVDQLKMISNEPTNSEKSETFSSEEDLDTTNSSSAQLLMKEEGKINISGFNELEDEDQNALLETTKEVAAGKRVSETQELDSSVKPFQRLKQLGKQVKNWIVRKVYSGDAVAIAIDEKVVRKAFNPEDHPDLSSHYVSRNRKYLPSLMVEVAALIRRGRLGQIIGHFFPFPQKKMEKGERQSLRKNEYLIPFMTKLHDLYGHLPLLADANYATKKMISWLRDKKWGFIM